MNNILLIVCLAIFVIGLVLEIISKIFNNIKHGATIALILIGIAFILAVYVLGKMS